MEKDTFLAVWQIKFSKQPFILPGANLIRAKDKQDVKPILEKYLKKIIPGDFFICALGISPLREVISITDDEPVQ